MGTARGRHAAPLTPLEEALFAAPHRFDFFQAVRLLERIARAAAARAAAAPPPGVGRDADPRAEPVRFRTLASLGFPVTAVASLSPARGGDETSPPEMVVAFLGLIGVGGALPDHYSELVIRRSRLRDRTLRDFLDLFDHRAISLFHRAWEKYRFAPQFERAAATPGADDDITYGLRAVAGRATAGHRGRLDVDDDVFLLFAGHFSRRTRPAVCLAAILSDYFEVDVRVEQFQGEFLRLPIAERTSLPAAKDFTERHNRLGVDAVLGGHAHDVRGRFRLRVGPLRWDGFRRFLPSGDLLGPFCRLARSYVGAEWAFDVRPVLEPDETPPLRLAADPPDSPRLGWNTWLGVKPLPRRFDGVSFSLDPH